VSEPDFFYAVYCGLMREHSQGIFAAHMNGHWRILTLFDAIHINNDSLIGPYVILYRHSGIQYADFFKKTLPLLFEVVFFIARVDIWFQHDGAPPRCIIGWAAIFRTPLSAAGGQVLWPDLIPLDCLLWECIRQNVYATEVQGHNLISLISVTATGIGDVGDKPRQLFPLRYFIRRHCEARMRAEEAA
jgi:hypothetical protein